MKEKAFRYIDDHQEEMLRLWADFVNTRSDATDKAKADAMADKIKTELDFLGFKTTFTEVGEHNGKCIDAILGEGRPGKPVLFTGHFDTVPLKGDYPFSIDENNDAHGLGCLDMKGGLVIAIWVVKALEFLGWKEQPIRFLLAGDEENGHQFGKTKEFLTGHAKGALCAFNMETGSESNAICIGRKGTGQAEITVHGIAAHSGNNFTEGRSAISEMMIKLQKIEKLTDLSKNTTVITTTIEGGTVTNSIPPVCKAVVDLRFGSVPERIRVLNAIQDIVADNTIDGTSGEVEIREFMAPFDTGNGCLALYRFVNQVSSDNGFGDMPQMFLGGGSDAGFIQRAGVPVICSVGVRGRFNHTAEEYASVDSLFERTKLFTAVMLRISEFEKQ